jgi:hypothetical protein
LSLLDYQRPDLLVTEISRTAHHSFTRVRNGLPVRQATTKGHEFRAGAGLGRAEGWLDAVLFQAAIPGVAPPRVDTIEAGLAKLHVCGNQGAAKSAVKAALQDWFGWSTDGWRESQADALAVGLGYLRLAEQKGHEQMLDDLARTPIRKSTPRRPRVMG